VGSYQIAVTLDDVINAPKSYFNVNIIKNGDPAFVSAPLPPIVVAGFSLNY
jgi:hypothetical protein